MLENSLKYLRPQSTCLKIVFVAVTTSLWPRSHALPSFPRRHLLDPVSPVSFGAEVTKNQFTPNKVKTMFSCANIIVVMTTKASQWDSFHVELAMECHGGKKIVTSCRVTCWLYHAAAGNSRGHFNIVEGCNAFHVVTLHVTSTSAPKALTLSLSRVNLAHSTSEVQLGPWTQNRLLMTRFGALMPRDLAQMDVAECTHTQASITFCCFLS